MKIQNFGGNIVKPFSLTRPGKQTLGSGPYEYFLYKSTPGESLVLSDLRSFTVYVLFASAEGGLLVDDITEPVTTGDAIQFEKRSARITTRVGEALLLVSGTIESHPSAEGINHTRHADLYKVVKPWGYELWINGQHPCYALKQIFVKAGTKTSLQYHNFKQETNALFEGKARLHFKVNESVENRAITVTDVESVGVEPTVTIGVTPMTLHRLEAVTDILLYETSTPHLDDVVRVQDDTLRPDGRITTEHLR